ncbi:hypothetical protein BLNAU_12106 [Blattamonas nauphoetae]|uniref:Uncharacterized protein n=1 Tax=Blattamonas nauphoetae TaxID=2049346 RepID=A0ABQ9XRM6_9EUKA|nr:hypothetical protein BLNAU_12106 [Blattamonas nauphoetae]
MVLISSIDQTITAAVLAKLRTLIKRCSTTYRFTLVKADLIPQLINTLNPQTLSFTEAEDIHINLMKLILESLWLATPYGLTCLEIADTFEPQSLLATIFMQTVAPAEGYICHLCVNRYSIVDGEQSRLFLILLARLLRISPFYRPTLEIVLHMPVVLTIPSSLTFFEAEQSIRPFLDGMIAHQRERNRTWREELQMWKEVDRMLRMEGIEDVMEEKLRNDKYSFHGIKQEPGCNLDAIQNGQSMIIFRTINGPATFLGMNLTILSNGARYEHPSNNVTALKCSSCQNLISFPLRTVPPHQLVEDCHSKVETFVLSKPESLASDERLQLAHANALNPCVNFSNSYKPAQSSSWHVALSNQPNILIEFGRMWDRVFRTPPDGRLVHRKTQLHRRTSSLRLRRSMKPSFPLHNIHSSTLFTTDTFTTNQPAAVANRQRSGCMKTPQIGLNSETGDEDFFCWLPNSKCQTLHNVVPRTGSLFDGPSRVQPIPLTHFLPNLPQLRLTTPPSRHPPPLTQPALRRLGRLSPIFTCGTRGGRFAGSDSESEMTLSVDEALVVFCSSVLLALVEGRSVSCGSKWR